MGRCATRLNEEGALYTLVYGALTALESRPIEIKPFFHYHPGSTALTFSTYSCNMECAWCQNYHLSRANPNPFREAHRTPEEIVRIALDRGDQGLCASFQEPTLLTDWLLDLFTLGRRSGLYCCLVSNGYLTPEALRALRDAGMDGLKVDVKGRQHVYDEHCGGARVNHIWSTVSSAIQMGVHVEVVNLMVTDVNDDVESIEWLVDSHLRYAGDETPLHFTRYHPAYRMSRPATAMSRLEDAHRITKERGVLYTYLGNVRHRFESTYCPSCGMRLIHREGHRVIGIDLHRGRNCAGCGRCIPLVGEPSVSR